MPRTPIPWARLAAEFVVIVVGVLVALGADAWWDSRQELAREGRVLANLLDEFRINNARLVEKVQWQSGIAAATEAVLLAASDGSESTSPDSLDHLLADMSWWGGAQSFEMSAVNAVISAGELTLIRSDAIRGALTDWQRRIAVLEQNERQDYDAFYGVWMPFMRQNSNLPQISNAIRHQPGSDEPNNGQPVPLSTQTNHLALLDSQEFVNVALQRRWAHNDILRQYDELRPVLEHVTAMLEEAVSGT